MTLYDAEYQRRIGHATSPGSSFTNTISATSILLSLATWTGTTDRIIMHFGETTFLRSQLDLLVSIHLLVLAKMMLLHPPLIHLLTKHLTPPLRGTPTNIPTNLIFPETRIIGLHFCR